MTTSSPNHTNESETLPTGRLLLAAALVVVEYVIAIFFFDSDRLPIEEGTNAFALLGESMPVVIVVMTAALLVGGGPSKEEMTSIVAAFRRGRRTWPWVVGHISAYGLALGVVIFVFNGELELQHPWVWIALWLGSAVCSVLLLVAAVVPREAVGPLGKPLARALGWGLLVGVLAMLAGTATSVLWRPMSHLTLEVVAFLLELTGHEVVGIPEELVVGTPVYAVFIDRQCSGYEGIGLITVLLGFYLLIFRRSLRFPNALVLLPIGMILIWLANSVRIAALIAVGTWISPETAEGGFHSAAGWLLFCVITLGLVNVSRHSGWFAVDGSRSKGSFRTPEGAYLLPLLVLIATALVTALFTAEFDYLYPLRVLTTLIPLWLFRDYYAELRWSWSSTPIALGVLVFVLWVALEPASDPTRERVIPDALGEMSMAVAGLWLVARVVGSVLIVPIAEELAFRGYLLRRLINADFTSVSPKHFTALSFLGSSIAFGVLHGRWVAGILAGMIYAAAQYRRGEVSDAIVAHAVTNGLLAVWVLAFGQWSFW